MINNNKNINNNKIIINFKLNKDNFINQKISSRVQEWLNKTLSSNHEMVSEFYGINYDQLILEPLSTQLEKLVKKLNESINLFNLLKRNLKNEKANEKLVSLYDEISELSSGMVDSKSSCLRYINTEQINKIIIQKYSMGSGVSRVGGTVNLLVAQVSADVDPKGLKNFYTSYHKLYWVSRHLDERVRSLFTLFEDALDSILNQFSEVYNDSIDVKTINTVLDKIYHFKENLSIEVKEISQPPPLLNLLISSSNSQFVKIFKVPVSEADSLDLTIIDKWFEFIIGDDYVEVVPFALKYSLLEPIKLNLMVCNKKLTNISKYLNQFSNSGSGSGVVKLDSIKEYFKQFENDENELLKSKEKCLELLLQDNVSNVIRGKKRPTGISSILNFDEFKLPGSQRQVSDKAIQELTSHLTESFDNLYNLIIIFLKSLRDSFSFFDNKIDNNSNINYNQIKEYQELYNKIQNSLIIEATTLSTLKK